MSLDCRSCGICSKSITDSSAIDRDAYTSRNRTSVAMDAFVTSIPDDYEPSAPRARKVGTKYLRDAAQTFKREAEMRLLRERRDSALRDVIALEMRMGLESRWTPTTPAFIETAQYIGDREYRIALDNLHRLVVQRLFELQSMNISHTGKLLDVNLELEAQTNSHP